MKQRKPRSSLKSGYVTARVEPSIVAKLQAIAEREDRSVSKVVSRILREYTEKAA